MDRDDPRELRDPEEREKALMNALPALVSHVFGRAPGYRRRDPDVVPEAVTDRTGLAKLRLLRKSELAEIQRADPPFGGLSVIPAPQAAKLFSSPGPVFELEPRAPDPWRASRALRAAGFRAGDVVHNSFSYHLTPAGTMVETGAHALGCAVIPAGTAPTEAQATAAAQFRATAYGGTPSFLKVLLDRGAELGLDLSSLKKASVTAEALPAALRKGLAERGVQVLQWYGTADAGLIAYETPAMEGLVLDEDVILEIVRPGTGDPVAAGEVGEVVVTILSGDHPLLRFATGDLSAILPGQSPCGRTNVRIRGWMGRADQSTKVRGLFVHPSHVAELVRRHVVVRRARVVVTRPEDLDVMTVRAEVAPEDRPGLREALAGTLRDLTQLRAEVELVDLYSLPNDGKVIDDQRPVG
ncbi:MAG TPA: AMP-binding protein [Myxococcaceae bacterium]|nr:AMP-binding protein [Myxococcaceae bacterium]